MAGPDKESRWDDWEITGEILTDNSQVTSLERRELFMSSQNLASAAGGCLRSWGQTMHLFELPPPVPWACTFESVDNWWDLFLFLLKAFSELSLLSGSASRGHLTRGLVKRSAQKYRKEWEITGFRSHIFTHTHLRRGGFACVFSFFVLLLARCELLIKPGAWSPVQIEIAKCDKSCYQHRAGRSWGFAAITKLHVRTAGPRTLAISSSLNVINVVV